MKNEKASDREAMVAAREAKKIAAWLKTNTAGWPPAEVNRVCLNFYRIIAEQSEMKVGDLTWWRFWFRAKNLPPDPPN